MTAPESGVYLESEPPFIPVLRIPIPESQISDDVRAGLDALAQEKACFMGSADELLMALRPEIEKFTTNLIQRSLQLAWLKRAESKFD